MGTTMTSIIIAILAGIGTFYTWNEHKGLSMLLAVVTLVAGLIGTLGAFIAALSLFFKLLPVIFVALGVYLIIKVTQKNSPTSPR